MQNQKTPQDVVATILGFFFIICLISGGLGYAFNVIIPLLFIAAFFLAAFC